MADAPRSFADLVDVPPPSRSRSGTRGFDAVRPGNQRRPRSERRGPNHAAQGAAVPLREQARELEQNVDLAGGVLDALVDNTVGGGIVIEPMVRTRSGEPHDALNGQILDAWNAWEARCDITGELHFDELQRLAARSLYRDGELFARSHRGVRTGIAHTERYPFALEPLEADHCPHDHRDERRRVQQGIERNGWGAPRAYWLYDVHPGEGYAMARLRNRLRRVPAGDVLHLRLVQRLGQHRGVSLFAPVIKRLRDIDEIEETERVAAYVAACFSAYIKKGAPDSFETITDDADNEYRELRLQPGMVFDDLEAGEDVGVISNSRPNNALVEFRASQLRAAASGTGTSYSTVARDYSGTYSSQRQALVEAYQHYRALSRLFIAKFVRPVYRDWLATMRASGAIRVTPDVDEASLAMADMRGPAMPWIDPVKEANGEILQIQAGLKSRSQSIRERGGNPREVFSQIQRERRGDADAGVAFTSTQAPAPEPVVEEEQNVVDFPVRAQRDAEAPMFYRDAQGVTASVVDAEARRVTFSFSSERTVLRRPLMAAPYNETLGHRDDEVDLTRLNNRANLLFNHRAHGTPDDVLGVVERAWVDAGRGYCTVRFSARPSAEGVWTDVRDGILSNVSVGYAIHKVRQQRADEDAADAPVDVRVTRWTPMEISLVSVPADASVGVGRAGHDDTSSPALKDILDMSDREPPADDAPAPDAAREERAQTINLDDHRRELEAAASRAAREAVAAEAARRAEITNTFAPFAEQLREVNSDLLQRALDDVNVTPAAAGAQLLTALASRSADGPLGKPDVTVVEDHRDKVRAAMTAVLETRTGVEKHELQGNEYASCTLSELARECLRAANEPTTMGNRMDMVTRAITTSDLPILLNQTLRRNVLFGYNEAEETYPQICRIVNISDFRQIDMPDVSSYPDLERIPEGGEYRYHQIGETGQVMKLETWGSICAVTRQAIVNDDLNALSTIPQLQGRAARRSVGNFVWDVLLTNPTLRDDDFAQTGNSTALFHANHGNLAAAGAPPDAATLDAGLVAMMNQTGSNGQVLNVMPALLIVPPTLLTSTRQLMASSQDPTATAPGVINPVQNFATVVTDSRLQRSAEPEAWYLSAAPAANDTIALGLLDGTDAPYFEEMSGWRVDGVELKVRIDAVAAPLSYRGLYKNPGV